MTFLAFVDLYSLSTIGLYDKFIEIKNSINQQVILIDSLQIRIFV